MQTLLLIMIPTCMATAALLIGYSVRTTRRGTVSAIGAVSQYGYDAAAVAPVDIRRREQSLRLERSMAVLARRLTPADYEQRLRRRLLQAGLYTTRAARFLALRVLSAVVLGAVGVLYATGSSNAGLRVLVVVLAPVVGWMLPDTLLSMRITRRLTRIERSVADMIDLLAITVQAGLSLDQAMKVTGERMSGPLADEMRLMLNEVRVGQDRIEALKRMSDRADTPTMRSFSRAMAQSEATGVSVGTTLKALAVDARLRRKAAAEEHAQKAPIKMIFPLAVCFFPAILVVAAGPGVLELMRLMGNRGG
jgi:tight adherence protein C